MKKREKKTALARFRASARYILGACVKPSSLVQSPEIVCCLGFGLLWLIMAYLDILDVPHTGLIQVQCRMLGEIHFLTTLVAVPEMSSSCGSSGDAKASCSGVAMVALQCPDLPGLFFDSNIRASLWVSMLWLLMFVDNIQITYNFYTISIQTKVDRKKAKEGVRLPRIFSHFLAFKETKSER